MIKKIFFAAVVLSFLAACGEANTEKGNSTNNTDSATHSYDSVGGSDSATRNTIKNMSNDSGYRSGGSHTN